MSETSKVWSAAWRVVVLFVVWGAATSALVVPVLSKYAIRGSPLSPQLRLYVETVSLFAALLTTWLMLRFADRRPFLSIGLRRRHAVRDAATGVVIGVAMIAVCIGTFLFFGWAVWTTEYALSGSTLAAALIAMLLNTVTQEVLVRGYVQSTLQGRFGVTAAVVTSAVFFLALHLGAIGTHLVPALSLFAAGVLLGTCYAVTGNLWLPIGLHFAWNALEGPVLGGAVSGQSLGAGPRLVSISGPPLATGGRFGLEGGLVAVAATVLATVLVARLYPRAARGTERGAAAR